MSDVGDSAFEDPFAEDWDDEEMNARASEFQRMLADVGDVEVEEEEEPTTEGVNGPGA
jgi:hypothetical protein